jgi:hypothetical protein
MKICTKCKIGKEDNEFQKYWHSTQKKFRIRKQCTLCLYSQHNERRRLKRLESKLIQVPIQEEIIQPVVQEPQPDLSLDKNYRKCRTCQEFKLETAYYFHPKKSRLPYLDCKICINTRECIRSKTYRVKELEENGGSYYHRTKPGQWVDDYQKKATYNILKAMGWKLNEENEIWWKEGIKTSDGVFINIKESKHKKLTTYNKAVQLRKEGRTYRQIGNELNLSETTIHNWLNNEKN